MPTLVVLVVLIIFVIVLIGLLFFDYEFNFFNIDLFRKYSKPVTTFNPANEEKLSLPIDNEEQNDLITSSAPF